MRRYVSLCVKLHKWLMENMEMAEPETLDLQKFISRSQNNFKRVLLNQCQSSFEQCAFLCLARSGSRGIWSRRKASKA